MAKQLDLDGNPMDLTERLIEEFCCKACYYAKKKPCTCRCGGKYHGVGKAQIGVQEIDRQEKKANV